MPGTHPVVRSFLSHFYPAFLTPSLSLSLPLFLADSLSLSRIVPLLFFVLALLSSSLPLSLSLFLLLRAFFASREQGRKIESRTFQQLRVYTCVYLPR